MKKSILKERKTNNAQEKLKYRKRYLNHLSGDIEKRKIIYNFQQKTLEKKCNNIDFSLINNDQYKIYFFKKIIHETCQEILLLNHHKNFVMKEGKIDFIMREIKKYLEVSTKAAEESPKQQNRKKSLQLLQIITHYTEKLKNTVAKLRDISLPKNNFPQKRKIQHYGERLDVEYILWGIIWPEVINIVEMLISPKPSFT